MATVRKSVIVPHSCATMFELVDRAEDYPRFLPWCPGARVLERSPTITHARIDIDYHGLKSHIVTRNEKSPPHAMQLELVEGPFEAFAGEWRFDALGAAGCRVGLAIDYAFSSRTLEAVLGPLFGHIMDTLVDRFVARAEVGAAGGQS
jgi:ribosome-associated toxin RatA of RatAB toxin-antitoxin module